MTVIGLDIGTTTLSAVALDRDGDLLAHRTLPHNAALPGASWERAQDPGRILSLCRETLKELADAFGPVRAVGLSGQMHGILYVNAAGRAVSPLYTWQDGRGSLAEGGESFAARLSRQTGHPLATGYGLVTHAHLLSHGGLPEGAAFLTTISAYVGMNLAGRHAPLLHASDAAGLGCFDLEAGAFDRRAVVSLAPEYLPPVTRRVRPLGETEDGALVMTGLGDNQASFLGAAAEDDRAALVNIGTGSQVSLLIHRPLSCPNCETRPLEGEDFLLVGSPLCGGRAYALLEKFLRECARLGGGQAESLYEEMNRLALTSPENPLLVDTSFCGTRAQPHRRGFIQNLGEDNFTPAHLVRGVLSGMATELFEYYQAMIRATGRPALRLIASGNGVRRNPALPSVLEKTFSLPLSLSPVPEEAAYGAALTAIRRL